MLSETDLKLLWKDLDAFEEDIYSESEKLKEIWKNIDEIKISINEEEKKLKESPPFDFLPLNDIIEFNIGGQDFQISAEILTRDPSSVLAVCCRKITPYEKDINGKYFFDRDWWLFRLILSFLRSKVLPSDAEVLRDLYKEAIYYRLDDLQKAIESIPIHHFSTL